MKRARILLAGLLSITLLGGTSIAASGTSSPPSPKKNPSLLTRITTGTKNLVGKAVGTVVKKKTSPPMKSQFSLGSHGTNSTLETSGKKTPTDWIGQKRLP
jgi:hypothetical protein